MAQEKEGFQEQAKEPPRCETFSFWVTDCEMIYVFKTDRTFFEQTVVANPGMYEISTKGDDFEQTFPGVFIAERKRSQ